VSAVDFILQITQILIRIVCSAKQNICFILSFQHQIELIQRHLHMMI